MLKGQLVGYRLDDYLNDTIFPINFPHKDQSQMDMYDLAVPAVTQETSEHFDIFGLIFIFATNWWSLLFTCEGMAPSL